MNYYVILWLVLFIIICLIAICFRYKQKFDIEDGEYDEEEEDIKIITWGKVFFYSFGFATAFTVFWLILDKIGGFLGIIILIGLPGALISILKKG